MASDFSIFRQSECIFNVDAEIADSILDLAMAEQDLNGAQVTSRPVDDRRLRSAKRVGAIFASYQTNPSHPFINEPGILPRAEVTIMVNPAWEDIIIYRAAPSLKPG